MAHLQKVVVSVDADEPSVLDAIAHELAAVGLDVDSVLESLSTITGTCDSDKVGSLAGVPGVLDVEPQRMVRIVPPARDVR